MKGSAEIRARCPASCGELIQGWLLGGEKLISYGIDCYSQVILTEGPEEGCAIPSKARQMLRQVMKYYGFPSREAEGLHLKIHSEIPKGKGMASSTADLAATALAAATLLGKKITEAEIAALCVSIEPTDSTVFSQMTLFDPLNGGFRQAYGPYPRGRVLLLEGREVIDTIEFRKTDRRGLLMKEASHLKKALSLVEEGAQEKKLEKLAQAATISALANQNILYKPQLEQLIEISLKLGALGVNVAHSGSVVGIIHQEGSFDQDKFIASLKRLNCWSGFQKFRSHQLVSGGAVLIE